MQSQEVIVEKDIFEQKLYIITFKGDHFKGIIERYEFRNMLEIEGIEEIERLSKENPILIIASPNFLSPSITNKIIQLSLNRLIGVVTGRTLKEASNFLDSTLNYHKHEYKLNSLLVMPIIDKTFQTNDENLSIITRKNIDSFHEEFNKEHSIFNILAHSHENQIFMHTNVLTWNNDDNSIYSKVQYFEEYSHNKKAYYFNNKPYKHLFINTCLSMMLGSFTQNNFSLGLHLIANTPISIIGTNRIKEGRHSENILYLRLLEHGYSLGEITSILNMNLDFKGFETPCYILIGNPCSKVSNTLKKNSSYNAICKKKHIELLVDQGSLFILDVDVAVEQLKDLLVCPYVDNNELENIYYSFVAVEKNKSKLLLYSKNVLESQNFKLEIIQKSALIKRLKHLHSFISNYYNLAYINQSVKSLERKIKNLETELKGLSSVMEDLTDLKSVMRLQTKIDVLYSLKEEISEEIYHSLISKIKKGKFKFTPNYQKQFYVEKLEAHTPCNYCMNETIEQLLTHNTNSDIKRKLKICNYCGVIKDTNNSLELTINIENGLVEIKILNKKKTKELTIVTFLENNILELKTESKPPWNCININTNEIKSVYLNDKFEIPSLEKKFLNILVIDNLTISLWKMPITNF